MDLTNSWNEIPTDKSRRVPTWAAQLIDMLARDRPPVLNRELLAEYLEEVGSPRSPEATERELRRLGWLRPLPMKGAWAFVAPGDKALADPYLGLHAWRQRNPTAGFVLAGEAAAWHLGYLSNPSSRAPAIWLPPDQRPPHGLRAELTVVRIHWSVDLYGYLGPTNELLRSKGFNPATWAELLPCFGPEALLTQLALRPASFRVWPDLVPRIDQLSGDCDLNVLTKLLTGQSQSAWQRACYILDCGGQRSIAITLFMRRPARRLAKVQFGSGHEIAYNHEFGIIDSIIAPARHGGRPRYRYADH